MHINYANDENFYAGIYELVKLGLMFRADHSKLQVELAGGY